MQKIKEIKSDLKEAQEKVKHQHAKKEPLTIYKKYNNY